MGKLLDVSGPELVGTTEHYDLTFEANIEGYDLTIEVSYSDKTVGGDFRVDEFSVLWESIYSDARVVKYFIHFSELFEWLENHEVLSAYYKPLEAEINEVVESLEHDLEID